MTEPTGLDLDRLQACLDRVRPGLVHGPLSGELIQGGKSNLTYRVGDGVTTWVVRRPPLGHVLRTAHDMSREYRVISALGATRVPVPAAIAFCEAETADEAPFYVMQDVPGTIYRTAAQAAALGRDRAHALAFSLVDVLADLHTVDPAAVGLGDFGRPDGYLQRQVRRWKQQLDASRSRELPGVDELFELLTAGIPAESGAGIVHGDFRLDNVIVNGQDQIVAVLDWEMATLGDPLADLGLSLVYWDLWLRPTGLFGEAAPAGALPTSADLTRRYAERRPFAEGLGWYLAFAYFKIAVILEGIHYRHLAGQTVGTGFDQVGAMVPQLVDAGLRQLREA
ncbi:aminoglycoside phosphotransferase (APT) family kinase protein [Hamadaea flava]|uniref:Phosphotransferase family protein n=1 Tax=Hamadaea flava TaxID=1742688 RepID=A0ABV8LJP2_9ACTN|nr:phosphotransferase family protein [Hamadaea flava]MCP2325301.1 aminoglycoside phosphotransferase (APT) family kinase protein [Hamadaea flava]